MGGVIPAIGAVLLVSRGFSAPFASPLAIGILLFVAGLLWK